MTQQGPTEENWSQLDVADELPLVAYYQGVKPRVRIVPASRWRDWMNATHDRNANKCLPLLVANEAGWFLLNERRFTAEWSGGDRLEDVRVRYEGVKAIAPAATNFGYGILTFPIPYLFRTPSGYDLLARGPANLPRDGIAPLDGLVETDWSMSPFTMNWKFTRPGAVTFEEGEPICMIVPLRRHDLERFRPAVRSAKAGDGEVGRRWGAAARSRHELLVRKFLGQYSEDHADARDSWQSDYFRGRTPDGAPAPEHVTKRRLHGFEDAPDC